ncbi:MAG: urease accessory protein UreD [Roseiflexaceae bacterium]
METKRSSAAISGRQEGRLDLLLELDGAVTRPVRCAVQPPLQLSRARYDESARPNEPALTLVHLGGILAGDHYDLRIALGDGAGARVTTAAATQVYRMPHGEATQILQLQLGAGSRLDWLPEPTILFGGARFSQITSVTLGPGARLALLDVLVPGRLARGEVYQFERYATRLEARDSAGRLLLAERALLEPRRHDLTAPGLLGTTPVLGSLYILGDSVDAASDCARVARRDGALSGLSPSINLGTAMLPNGCGMLVRALGTTASGVHAALLTIWGALSQEGDKTSS